MRNLQFVSIMREFLSAAILVVCWGANFFKPCLAQEDLVPAWTESTTTKVKPEMRQEFEGHLKQLLAAYRKGGTLWFLSLETFTGDTSEYTTVVPVMKFADLDGPPVAARVLEERNGNVFAAKSLTAAPRGVASTRRHTRNSKSIMRNRRWESIG